MSTTVMEVPESQRLIAVSLGKIAASRSQKGGINLHKNLLVATVLHKARTAYMIQHFARQRSVSQTAPPSTTTTTQPPSVEMREKQQQQQQSSANNVSDSSSPSSPVSSSPSPASTTAAAAAPTFLAAPTVTGSTHSASVDATPETGSVPDGADVSAVQVAECEDKENTPPLASTTASSCGGDATLSPHCEKRLHGECAAMDTQTKDSKEAPLSSSSSPRSLVVSHALNNTRQDYVSSNSRKCGSSNTSSSSSCLLKRRRTMDSNHENVSAPKVRIVEARLSTDSNPEPMQCDSPQISNLVNIFNTSFAGLSGAAGGDMSVRSVGQSLLAVSAGHKVLSDNMTCAKEIKMGLDSSVRQPLVLSV